MPGKARTVVLLSCVGATSMATPAALPARAPAGYEIDATYDPARQMLSASVRVAFGTEPGAMDSLHFVLHAELRATSVRVGQVQLRCDERTIFYEQNYAMVANQVTCPLDGARPSDGVTIEYEGRFNPSAARSPSDYFRGDSDGLYLRAGGYSYWFPFFLAPSQWDAAAPPIRARLVAPAGFTSVMNGRHLGHREEEDGRVVDEWEVRDLRYLDLQYSVRRYARYDAQGLTAFGLDDGDSRAAGQRVADFGAELVRRYRSIYRERAASDQVFVLQLPRFGAIASGNVVGVPDDEWRAFSATSSSASTLAHELVHAYATLAVPANDRLYALGTEGAVAYFHLPVLSDVRGDSRYDTWLDRVQQRYLDRLAPGYTDRAGILPPLKPLLDIRAGEIGLYKDRFLLADRALLFWDFMRRRMGHERFDRWVREITNARRMNLVDFYQSVRRHAPDLQSDLRIWLETTDYPERFRRG